jgi:hypothetical protein
MRWRAAETPDQQSRGIAFVSAEQPPERVNPPLGKR